MFNWLKRKPRNPSKLAGVRAERRRLQARYDAAATNDENRRHWANADGLSADAATLPEVRRALRNRARYEAANNSYAAGIVSTLANDVIGTGPRLQMLTSDPEVNRAVEAAFTAWARRQGLPELLRMMRRARAVDGETFALLTNDDSIEGGVRLRLRLVEADQVATPDIYPFDPLAVDGIRFDAAGNPVEYHVLKAHPGDGRGWSGLEYERYPAHNVIHYFRPERAGQHRGVPEITPALPLFAQLRRYTLAVIAAAESAADFAGILHTDTPPSSESDDVEPLDTFELERRTLLSVPAGWKMSQIEAEQPTTTYKDFKREIINEIARCLNVPFNVAAADSSSYNYASGRMDHQVYFKAIRVDQEHLAWCVLDRIFEAWLAEAVLVTGLLPQQARTIRPVSGFEHQWFFDGGEHVDPAKEANAQATRLANHTTTLAAEFARQGRDWEAELRQRANELALMRELGLPLSTSPGAADAEDDEADGEIEVRDAA